MQRKNKNLKSMLGKINLNYLFLKNVFTLVSGSVAAQAITILALPVLTRLWSPKDFGLFASYVAIVSILEVLFMGRFDMALMLPKKNKDALNVMLLGFYLSIIFVILFYLLFIFQFFFKIIPFINFQLWFFIIPLGSFIYSSYSLMIAWNNRSKKYKIMSHNRIIQSGSVSLSQIFFAFNQKFSFGLIYADLLGRFLALTLIIKNSNFFYYNLKINLLEKKKLFNRYKNFFYIQAPSSLINVCSNNLAFLILPIIFSPKIAGLYFLVYRILLNPSSLISNSILEVFKNRVQDDFLKKGSCRSIFIKTTLSLFMIGIIPTVIIIFFATDFFTFFFGNNWLEAGKYAEILAPLILIRFISSPISYILVFREKLFIILILQLLFLILNIFSLYYASISMSVELAIWSLMISGMVFYVLQIIFAYKFSKDYE